MPEGFYTGTAWHSNAGSPGQHPMQHGNLCGSVSWFGGIYDTSQGFRAISLRTWCCNSVLYKPPAWTNLNPRNRSNPRRRHTESSGVSGFGSGRSSQSLSSKSASTQTHPSCSSSSQHLSRSLLRSARSLPSPRLPEDRCRHPPRQQHGPGCSAWASRRFWGGSEVGFFWAVKVLRFF